MRKKEKRRERKSGKCKKDLLQKCHEDTVFIDMKLQRLRSCIAVPVISNPLSTHNYG
jgi:hypothetical protein